jgi:hypothetical protein
MRRIRFARAPVRPILSFSKKGRASAAPFVDRRIVDRRIEAWIRQAVTRTFSPLRKKSIFRTCAKEGKPASPRMVGEIKNVNVCFACTQSFRLWRNSQVERQLTARRTPKSWLARDRCDADRYFLELKVLTLTKSWQGVALFSPHLWSSLVANRSMSLSSTPHRRLTARLGR